MPLLILPPLILLLHAQFHIPAFSFLTELSTPWTSYLTLAGVAALVLLMRQWVWLYWLALLAAHQLAWELAHETVAITLLLGTSLAMALLAAVPRPQLATVSGVVLLVTTVALPLAPLLLAAEPVLLLTGRLADQLVDTVSALNTRTIIMGILTGQALVVLAAMLSRPVRSAVHWGQCAIWVTFAMLYLLAEPPDPMVYAASLTMALLVLLSLSLQMLHLAYVDELTQLPQRRALERHLTRLGRRSAITMLDVDHFKKFNDTWGHDAGDQVLRLLGSILGKERGLSAYRYGGEEFTLVFNHNDRARIESRLETLRQRIAEYPLAIRQDKRPVSAGSGKKLRGRKPGARTVRVSISLGCAIRQKGEPAEALMARADKALYSAKKAGRNRLVLRQ